jgi:hypothetical protein
MAQTMMTLGRKTEGWSLLIMIVEGNCIMMYLCFCTRQQLDCLSFFLFFFLSSGHSTNPAEKMEMAVWYSAPSTCVSSCKP